MPIDKGKLNAALSGFLLAVVLFAAYLHFTGASTRYLGVLFLLVSAAMQATKPKKKTT